MEQLQQLQQEFIPYELAYEIKELGFEEICIGYYENQEKIIVVKIDSHPILTKEEQKKIKLRPLMYKQNIKNSKLPQWATAAPTWRQIFRWIRKRYNIESVIQRENDFDFFKFTINSYKEKRKEYLKVMVGFKTYEEAEFECLKEIINITKKI